jgi:GDPmannose 4,6-dehydratase
LLLTLLGYEYTVHEENNEKYGKSWRFRQCFFYQYNQGEQGKKIKFVDYDDYVYDISVEEVENFATGVGNIVVHNSHVQVSFEVPYYTGQVDALGTLNILEAVKNHSPQSKILQASTSELFGKVVETPQSETTPFYPRSPYGVAKLYGYWITKNYRESYDLYACNSICFNHESPRRTPTFVTRKITSELVKIKCGEDKILRLGNMDAKRDWGHAKEYAEAMCLILQQDKPDDFVIATGKMHSVRECVELASGYLGFDIEWVGKGINEKGYDKNTGQLLVEIDPKYFRPAEVDLLLGNPAKAKEKLGWEAKIKFEDLIKEIVESDLDQYKKTGKIE